MTAPSVSLLPCPFCGEERIYLNEPDPSINFKGSINCPACLAAIPHEVNREEMIECWNTRATPPAPTPSGGRERIARVIDPYAWIDLDDMTPTERFVREKQLPRLRDEALAKADAILALLPDAAAIRAAAFEEAARWHDDQARIEMGSLHCGDNTSIIAAARRRADWHTQAAAAIRAAGEK